MRQDVGERQVGAATLHRTLARFFRERGVKLVRTYQLDIWGNTEEFISSYGRGSSEPSERRAAAAQD